MVVKMRHVPHWMKKRAVKKEGNIFGYKNYHNMANALAVAGMIEESRNLIKIKRTRNLGCFDYENEFDCCFVWSETPQGHDYWCNVNKILGKLGY